MVWYGISVAVVYTDASLKMFFRERPRGSWPRSFAAISGGTGDYGNLVCWQVLFSSSLDFWLLDAERGTARFFFAVVLVVCFGPVVASVPNVVASVPDGTQNLVQNLRRVQTWTGFSRLGFGMAGLRWCR